MYQMLLYDLKSFGQFYFCEFLLNTKNYVIITDQIQGAAGSLNSLAA